MSEVMVSENMGKEDMGKEDAGKEDIPLDSPPASIPLSSTRLTLHPSFIHPHILTSRLRQLEDPKCIRNRLPLCPPGSRANLQPPPTHLPRRWRSTGIDFAEKTPPSRLAGTRT
ncbi:hypothetical protein Vafri_20316 [Volvox africanus]|uniref:Uncharacterized protein n=1 Tax=Volvox africanus TaxID=51714 RepID=A0A8J4FA92_9CHLO|nr:hypothetical protein Vafri_20316 [Volvox africanus]